MPLSIDPESTALVCLKTDEAKPEASRPAFEFRFLTCRQVHRHDALRDKYFAAKALDERIDLARQMIGLALVGWRNIPVQFSADAIEDVLTESELSELALGYPDKLSLSEAERRDFFSRRPTDGASSATTDPVNTATSAPPSPSDSTTAPAPSATAATGNASAVPSAAAGAS